MKSYNPKNVFQFRLVITLCIQDEVPFSRERKIKNVKKVKKKIPNGRLT